MKIIYYQKVKHLNPPLHLLICSFCCTNMEWSQMTY